MNSEYAVSRSCESCRAWSSESSSIARISLSFCSHARSFAGPACSDGRRGMRAIEDMSAWSRKELGRFYHPHNAQLLHLFNAQGKVTYSPSLKSLGIQSWSS